MLTHNTSGGCGKACCQDPNVCPRTYFFEVLLPQARELFGWADFIVMDAADYGTPQFRRRVFLVAGPHRLRWPTPTHGEATQQETLFGRRLKPWRTVRDALGLGGIVGSGLKGSEWPTDRAAPCIRDGNGTAGLYVRTEQRGATATAITMPAPTVPTVGNQYLHEVDPGTRAASEPERLDRPAPCVTGSEVKGSGENANPQKMQRASDALFLATGRCRLTVRECAALFDMPADYPWQGTKTSKYRQIGNMVAWKCAAALGRAVKDADA
jgi:site-specific DNA-cytosine methylase